MSFSKILRVTIRENLTDLTDGPLRWSLTQNNRFAYQKRKLETASATLTGFQTRLLVSELC